MNTKIVRILALSSILFSSLGQADDGTLFSIDDERIKAIAREAAYEGYPEILPEDLLNRMPNGMFVIWCWSAAELGYVTNLEEDVYNCYASVEYKIEGTEKHYKFMNDDGRCISQGESEGFQVKVYPDGSTEVGPRWLGTGNSVDECTDEYEGWSE